MTTTPEIDAVAAPASALGAAPIATGRRKRRARAVLAQRPGWITYGFLGAVLAGAILPMYWALLIASGDSSSLNNPDLPWWPGGNFLSNGLPVLNSDRVPFWKAALNSLIVSTVVSASVVFFSTLAGYAGRSAEFKR